MMTSAVDDSDGIEAIRRFEKGITSTDQRIALCAKDVELAFAIKLAYTARLIDN